MARIRNSSRDNAFGGGKEQIFTDNNGKGYTIKNSSRDNAFGDGKEKVIVENGSSGGGLEEIIPWWVTVIILVICFIIQRCLA